VKLRWREVMVLAVELHAAVLESSRRAWQPPPLDLDEHPGGGPALRRKTAGDAPVARG
jgi:hypothetical protein